MFIGSHLATSMGEAVLPRGTAAAAALATVPGWFLEGDWVGSRCSFSRKREFEGEEPGREGLVSGKVTFISSRHSPELWQGG